MTDNLQPRARSRDRLDPTDYDAFEAGWEKGDGLNYATNRLSIKQQNEFTLFIFAKAAVIGFFASIVVLVVAPILADFRLLPVFVLVGTLLSLMYLLQSPSHLISSPLVLLTFVGGWLIFTSTTLSLAVFWGVMCVSLIIAHQAMLHFSHWRATPPVEPELAEQLRANANRMIWSPLFWIQLLSIPAFGVFVTPHITTFFEDTSLSLWAYPLTVLVFAAFLILLPFVFGVFRGKLASPAEMVAGTWKAIRSYVNYGRMESEAATDRYSKSVGTFHSPAGLVKSRVAWFHITVVALAATLLPLCDYFPTSTIPAEPFDGAVFLGAKPEYDASMAGIIEEHQAQIRRLKAAPYNYSHAQLVEKLEEWDYQNAEALLPRVQQVRAYPGNWVLHFVARSGQNTATLFNLSASILLMLLVPGTFLFLFCFALGGNYNGLVYAATKDDFAFHEGSNPSPPKGVSVPVDTTRRWNALVREVQRKTPGHIYVGRNLAIDAPFLVDISHFKEHVHYLGGTGSGKTALGLAPLVSQLVRMGDCNVIVFDLKDDRHDRSFFENARIEAEAAGHDFKFFTTRPELPTHLCNPFLEPEGVLLDVDSRAEQLAEALGLLYEEQYGASYYSEVSVTVARRVFDMLIDDSGYRLKQAVTFPLLLKCVDEFKEQAGRADKKLVEDASHFASILKKYTYLPTINYTPEATDPELVRGSIALEDLYDETKPPQVYFFGFNGQTEPKRAGGLTRLFCNRLMKTGQFVEKRPRQTFVIIDEFQLAASPQFTIILDQARAAKVGLIVANQSVPAIAKAGGESLEAAIFDNVAYRQVFRVEALEELKRFEALAGECIRQQVTHSETRDRDGEIKTTSRSVKISEESRYNLTDFRAMNANKMQSIAFATKNAGLTQTGGMAVLIESDYHISQDEMEERAKAKPPELTPERTTAFEFKKTVATQPQLNPKAAPVHVPKRFHHGTDNPED